MEKAEKNYPRCTLQPGENNFLFGILLKKLPKYFLKPFLGLFVLRCGCLVSSGRIIPNQMWCVGEIFIHIPPYILLTRTKLRGLGEE